MAMQIDRVPHLECECGNNDVFHVLAFVPSVVSVKDGGIMRSDDNSVMLTDKTMCVCDKCGKRGIIADFLDEGDAELANAVDAAEADGLFTVGDVVGRA